MKKWQKVLIWVAVALIVIFCGLMYLKNYFLVTAGDIVEKAGVIPAVQEPLTKFDSAGYGWEAWRGADNKNTAGIKGIKTDWSKGLEKAWGVDYLCQGAKAVTWSCPVISGNRLVVPGRDEENDLIFCLDPKTGALLWMKKFPMPADINYGRGPRATPLIVGDFVYTISRTGVMYCLALFDGALAWEFDSRKEGGKPHTWGLASSPVLFKNTIIMQVGGASLLYALDKKTGKIIWRSEAGFGSYATPVLIEVKGAAQLAVFFRDSISGFNPVDGKKLWNMPWGKNNDLNITTPVFDNGKLFVTTFYTESGLLDLTTAEPSILWKNKKFGAHHTDPFITDGYIYGYTGFSSQNSGSFMCLSLKDGSIQWQSGEMGWGTCIMADGYLVCQDNKGALFLVKPDPKKLIVVTKFPAAMPEVKTRTWTKPVIAQDMIYLRHGNWLLAYKLK